jgi:mannose-6-phosphate isomerase-like protein (cupin superfamily)
MPLQIDLSASRLICLDRAGNVSMVTWESGPPPRIDGYTVGLNTSDPSREPRHGGERHPDADEVLFLISGRLQVTLDEEAGEVACEVVPGQAIVIPRGVWHRVAALESSQFLNITPGPRGEWWPLAAS